MKVSTITCSNADNYGARLQACALAAWLAAEGHDASVIDYRPWYMRSPGRIWPSISRISDLRTALSVLFNYRYCRDGNRRRPAMERFSALHIPLTTQVYGSADELSCDPPDAETFIAGSDQIWNHEFPNGKDPAFYLHFAPRGALRISYAASFGDTASVAPESRDTLRGHLSAFDHISVRENKAADLVASLGFQKPFVAVDPVFLLPPEYWLKLAAGQSSSHEPYVLVYDFLRSRAIRSKALHTARALGCRIVSTGKFRLDYADENHTTSSPEEFLALLRDARCIISNSFHATAFAMIFRRDFKTVEREDGLNERLHNLLERYGLDIENDAPVDYDRLIPLLQADIASSEKFLRSALASK